MRPDDEIEITPDSRQHAVVSDVVLRESAQIRLVFRPEMVENEADPNACIRGTFLYQRKRRADEWTDEPTASLASLKSGEGYKLELRSGELLNLLRQLGALVRRHARHGLPRTRVELVKVEQGLADLLTMDHADLSTLLQANRSGAMEIVSRVLRWIATNAPATTDRLPDLSLSVSVAALREAMTVWQANVDNANEEFWQNCIERRTFLLSQVFSYPIVVLQGKAYVGGKRYDNRHGNIADFLGKVRTTGCALIVEIKTPATLLLGAAYRQDVFPPSRDLAGSISQALHYKASFQAEWPHLRDGLDAHVEGHDPRCLIVLGNVGRELQTPAMRKSFEQFRERVSGVTIIGFDEFFARTEDLVTLLTNTASAATVVQT